MEDRRWKNRNEKPSSTLHPPSSPDPGSRDELAGRRRHDDARVAAAAGKIPRRAHRAALPGQAGGLVVAAIRRSTKRFPSRPTKMFSPSRKSCAGGASVRASHARRVKTRRRFARVLAPPNLSSRWCCPIRRARRLKPGWLAFRIASATPDRGGIYSLPKPSRRAPTQSGCGSKRLPRSRTLIANNSKLKTQNLKTCASSPHQIQEYLHLAAVLGANPEPLAPQLTVTPEEIETAKKKFGLENVAQPIFGLNPGAEYGPAKRWPTERFIAAAREIQKRTNCVWLIFGGAGRHGNRKPNEIAILATPKQGRRAPRSALRNLSGQTSLRELMALLKLCRVLLTNDSGPMHVAAALGTPVVVPYGSTSPELTGPGLPGDPLHRLIKSDAPCSPCFLRECPIDFRCMKGITVERVAATVIEAATASS